MLAAVIALPFTLIRLKLSRDQAKHAAEALYNDKMNTAVADLYAQRQVTEWTDGIASNGWQDDIPRRNGTIDRLKGLTDENPDLLPRVDRLLSVYLRELTREYPAQKPKDGATPGELRKWARTLKPPRPDMENAAQTLSRLQRPDYIEGEQRLPDLHGMNLQGFNLVKLNLNDADLSRARLQGAGLFWTDLQRSDLFEAQLQGADVFGAELQEANLSGAQLHWATLRGARMQRANLSGAQLQGADLSEAELQGANLSGAQLQGADLSGARFDSSTSLTAATLRGAAVREVDFTSLPKIVDHLEGLFGDATVKLPQGINRPDRFNVTYKDWDEFETAWRAFQRSIGQDPDNPE